MKKFLHSEPGEIEAMAALFREGWHILLCSVAGPACRKVDHSALRTYFDETQRLWGLYPGEYLLATTGLRPKDTSLAATMRYLQADHAGDVIALVGYNDGGVISLSHETLPTQQNAKPAEWWSGNFAI